MNLFNTARGILNFGEAIYTHGTLSQWTDDVAKQMGSVLHSNDAINQIGSAVMSPLATIGGIARNEGIANTLKNVYTKEAVDEAGNVIMREVTDKSGKITKEAARELDVGNIAGSLWAANMGLRTVSGLTHDSGGNFDVAGIPMI